jgi:hypothetical protein
MGFVHPQSAPGYRVSNGQHTLTINGVAYKNDQWCRLQAECVVSHRVGTLAAGEQAIVADAVEACG